MSFLKKLLGSGKPAHGLTAREAFSIASEDLTAAYPGESENAYLCCVYTSVHDSNAVVEIDGTCQAWHFDFFLPTSRALYLVRVQKGSARGKKIEWEKTGKAPIEYTFATYGMQSADRILSEPPPLPGDWFDSPAIVASICDTLWPGDPPENRDVVPAALFLPAEYLRYLHEQKAREALSFPPAPPDSFAAICTTEELYDEDSYLLYIKANSSEILDTRVFRFPNLFYFGSSMHW